jgi:hypothetical protein
LAQFGSEPLEAPQFLGSNRAQRIRFCVWGELFASGIGCLGIRAERGVHSFAGCVRLLLQDAHQLIAIIGPLTIANIRNREVGLVEQTRRQNLQQRLQHPCAGIGIAAEHLVQPFHGSRYQERVD